MELFLCMFEIKLTIRVIYKKLLFYIVVIFTDLDLKKKNEYLGDFTKRQKATLQKVVLYFAMLDLQFGKFN